MKKITIAILGLFVFFASNANAQQNNDLVTYEFDSHEFNLGYGFGSAVKWVGGYDNNPLMGDLYEGGNYWGAINIGYLYRFSEYVTFGISYGYTGLRRDIFSNGKDVGNSRADIHIIMPEFKSNWYRSNSGFVTLYSRASAGLAVAAIEDQIGVETYRDTQLDFAFQVSPIGIEVGNKFAFYVEAGFGYKGIIVTGFRYAF